MVLSVKGGGIRPTDLRDLRAFLADHDMTMAGFLSLKPPSKAMWEEAAQPVNSSRRRQIRSNATLDRERYPEEARVSYANEDGIADFDGARIASALAEVGQWVGLIKECACGAPLSKSSI